MEGCQGGKKENEVKSIKIELEGLVCECSYDRLASSLSSISGIFDVDIDKKLKAAFIDYDPVKITEDQIKANLAEA